MRVFNVFLYPLAWFYVLTIHFRRMMFEKGIWKSVEFELATISVIHGSGKLDWSVVDWLNSWFNRHDQKAGGFFIPIREFRKESLASKLYKASNYLMQIVKEDVDTDYLDTRFSKVLGMSEAYVQFPDLKVFMMYETKYYTEVRSDIQILLLDTSNDNDDFHIWPLGQRKHVLSDMSNADFVILTGDFSAKREVLSEMIGSLGQLCCLVLLKSKEERTKEGSEVAEYLFERIDIVVDHDIFGRLLMQRVEEINRKKKGYIES